jgi:hypothetical protein
MLAACCTPVSCLADSSTLKIEVICSPETSADFDGLHSLISQKIKLIIVPLDLAIDGSMA